MTGITNTSGTIQERYTEKPYGAVTFRDGSGSTISVSTKGWDILHQGAKRDIIGDYDFRNRVYSPTLGRWLSNDPIGFEAGDVNTFRYVGNGPGNGLDPQGLQDKYAKPNDTPPPDSVEKSTRPKPAEWPPPIYAKPGEFTGAIKIEPKKINMGNPIYWGPPEEYDQFKRRIGAISNLVDLINSWIKLPGGSRYYLVKKEPLEGRGNIANPPISGNITVPIPIPINSGKEKIDFIGFVPVYVDLIINIRTGRSK